jgi:serine/threonine protein kinase
MQISDHEAKPQTQLNQYVLAGRLDRGSSVNVHLAIKIATGRMAAAKVVRLDDSRSQALQREIRNMRRLHHPSIVCLIEVLHRRDTGTVYLILEHAHGSLKGQRFTEPQARWVFSQVAEGLMYLHRQRLVRKDIEPSNPLLFEGAS